MQAQLRASKMQAPGLAMSFYNSLVVPVLSYGAQVWAPDKLSSVFTFEHAMVDPMVDEQKRFMCSVVGAKLPTRALLYRELGQRPLQAHWAVLVLRFWNGLVANTDTLYHRVFRADLELAESGVQNCWSKHMIRFLSRMGIPAAPPTLDRKDRVGYYATLKVDVHAVTHAFNTALDNPWNVTCSAVTPRGYVGEGTKCVRYNAWSGLSFGIGAKAKAPLHCNTAISREEHVELMRFRLGCWGDIEINAGQRNGVDRSKRLCKRCTTGAVEDELHVFMECDYYRDIRVKFEDSLGFAKGTCMARIMTHAPPRAVAAYLAHVRAHRAAWAPRPGADPNENTI
jgi:hypothetical protein